MTTVAARAQRSWTDPVWNNVLFAPFDGLAYIKWFTQRDTAPAARLTAAFMHEFTHVWCYDSAVGRVAATLKLQCRVSATLEQPDWVVQLQRDLVLFEALRSVLLPFEEGLALFAEFDLWTGQSPIGSQPTLAHAACFGPVLKGVPEQDFDRVQFLAAETARLQGRLDETAVLRRRSVLVRPWNEAEPYLKGYMAIKGLWAQMRGRAQALDDPQLFLSFVRAWFFEDETMVRLLIDPPKGRYGIELCRDLLMHLSNRLDLLLAMPDLEARVAYWVAACLLPSSDGEEEQMQACATLKLMALRADLEAVGEGAMLLIERWGEGLSEGKKATPEDRLALMPFIAHQERHLSLLGTVPVSITEEAGKRFMTAVADASASLKLGKGGLTPGEAELLFVTSTRGAMLVSVLRRGTEIEIVNSAGLESSGTERDLLIRFCANRPILAKVTKTLDDNLKARISTGRPRELLSDIENLCDQIADAFCTSAATSNLPESAWNAAKGALREGGMLGLLGGDLDALHALAILGLVHSSDIEDVDALCAEAIARGASPEAVARLTTGDLVAPHGLTLVERRGRRVIGVI